tara:strand:- start:20403 stop:20600 length:198 start_codon:yes stop_codon:yes gene_type:complete
MLDMELKITKNGVIRKKSDNELMAFYFDLDKELHLIDDKLITTKVDCNCLEQAFNLVREKNGETN